MAGVLVTGGAGYIGSHVVSRLCDLGERTVVLDDLSTGSPGNVLCGDLVVGDAGDRDLVLTLLREHRLDAVLHFAARTSVPESLAEPLRYYGENASKTRNLLTACLEAGTPHFVFSSSAAVYGIPDANPVSEGAPANPINPYGASKLTAEWILRDVTAAGGPRPVVLRYFNVAGADPDGRLGQTTPDATLLFKVACEAAVGWRDHVAVFGTDFPTRDGTGVRDYIHVADLAEAHLAALDYLRRGGEPVTLNVGYGRGHSVREVLAAVEEAAGHALPVREAPRRPGDPPELVAASERIRRTLGWRPRYADLNSIASTALAWERRLAGRTATPSEVPKPGAIPRSRAT